MARTPSRHKVLHELKAMYNDHLKWLSKGLPAREPMTRREVTRRLRVWRHAMHWVKDVK